MVQVFVLIVFLSGLGMGVIDAFLFIRIKELGGSGLVMGISRSITCAAEVPSLSSSLLLSLLSLLSLSFLGSYVLTWRLFRTEVWNLYGFSDNPAGPCDKVPITTTLHRP